MKLSALSFCCVFFAIVLMAGCAKTGRPDGGPKDSIPPIIVKSNPENFTTSFDKDEIRIYFNEYIRLKDLQQNLIISPPLKYQPLITPLNTSKVLKIRIQDTLLPETTYSINFGKSIVDNNEENSFDYFKYVFSTGSYIDSLTLSGRISDPLLRNPEDPATVMLYPYDESTRDSIIFNELPTYITSTRDSSYSWQLENVKAGRYLLVALNESSSNYTYQPETDQIGYIGTPIELPADTSYVLKLFRQEAPYEIARPTQLNKRHIIFGYQGLEDTLVVEPLGSMPEDFESRVYFDQKSDTLHYWFKPALDHEVMDTVYFTARHKTQLDTVLVRLKDLYADSLMVNKLGSNVVKPKDTVFFGLNTPLDSLDREKISVMDQDSTQVPFEFLPDMKYNRAGLLFSIEDDKIYHMTLLPGSITDFYEETNDTLKYAVRSQPVSDYGTLALNLPSGLEYPLTLQLVDSRYQVGKQQYLTEPQDLYFDYINPGIYYVRILVDKNKNGRWDSGNYVLGLQPEPVFFDKRAIEVRANWSLNETVKLD